MRAKSRMKKKGVAGKERKRVAYYKWYQGRGRERKREEKAREQDKERKVEGWDRQREEGKETERKRDKMWRGGRVHEKKT